LVVTPSIDRATAVLFVAVVAVSSKDSILHLVSEFNRLLIIVVSVYCSKMLHIGASIYVLCGHKRICVPHLPNTTGQLASYHTRKLYILLSQIISM